MGITHVFCSPVTSALTPSSFLQGKGPTGDLPARANHPQEMIFPFGTMSCICSAAHILLCPEPWSSLPTNSFKFSKIKINPIFREHLRDLEVHLEGSGNCIANVSAFVVGQ